MLFTFRISYIACIVCRIWNTFQIDFHSQLEKLSRVRRKFRLPRRSPLPSPSFVFFSYESRPTRFILYSRMLPFCACENENARVRKPKKIFSATMWVYIRKPRLVATTTRRGAARRLKEKRACLANISKTKCKLTRRTFGVYTTPRSRGSRRSRRERCETLSAQ